MNEKGIILLWVLIIAFIFSLLFIGLYPKLHLWGTIANKVYGEPFIDWGFYSSIEYAKKLLIESAYFKFNNPNQLWAKNDLVYKFSEDYGFKITITDEDGKFPLNNLFSGDFINPIDERSKKIFERLIKIARFPYQLNELPKLWAERINIYQIKPHLITFEEFISFSPVEYKHIFNEEYLPLSNFVTVYSSGKININTIRKEVFLALSDSIREQNFTTLQTIINNGQENGIKNLEELSHYSEFESFYNEIKEYLTTESIFFVVESEVFWRSEEVKKRFLLKKTSYDGKIKFDKIGELPVYMYSGLPDIENIKYE
ncbi:MAG: hypothetical protein ACK4NF_00030 [Planctomycetota bacterium]